MSVIVQFVPRHRVTALVPGPVSPLDLGAVTEVFGIDPGLEVDWYEFSVCAEQPGRLGTRGGLDLVIDRGIDELAAADTIVVLPVARYVRERPPDRLLEALVAARSRGCRIVAVCLGTFLLAPAGLLNGRRATTHWRFCYDLASAFPEVQVVPDALYVDEGDVLTSGGVAAGIDVCLHLVRRDHGAETANQLARRLVFGPHRDGGQAQFIDRPVADLGDGRLKAALSRALEHLPEEQVIDRMADVACMSRRTFYREFRATTGTTPHRWLVTQRIIVARRILETTGLSVEQAAGQAGFRDVSVFRRHFIRQVGLSPTAYRRRFRQSDTHADRPG